MKAITYNPQREVLTAILLLILSMAVLTSVKAQRSTTHSYPKGPKTVLSEEKAVKPADLAEKTTRNNGLALKVKSWISNGSYWDRNGDEEPILSKLAQTITNWISNGSYWSSTISKEMENEELALSNKAEMNRGALVDNE
jgi:hypothetical protein